MAGQREARQPLSRVGRMSGLALTLLGVVYALFLVERVLYSFLLTETMATFMGISFMGGILWQRTNRLGSTGKPAGFTRHKFLVVCMAQ